MIYNDIYTCGKYAYIETTCQLTRKMSFFEARPAISKGEKKQSLDPAEGFENSLVLGYVTCLILRH